MARRRENPVQFPATLLDDVSWTFRGEPFGDRAAFYAALREHNGPDWSDQFVQQIVLCVPRVLIEPDVWRWNEVEPVLELTPDNGTSFPAGELLFKVHNAWVATLRQMDHKYFEGFSLAAGQEPGRPPRYELCLGS